MNLYSQGPRRDSPKKQKSCQQYHASAAMLMIQHKYVVCGIFFANPLPCSSHTVSRVQDHCWSAQRSWRPSHKDLILQQSGIVKDRSESRFSTHVGNSISFGQPWVSMVSNAAKNPNPSGRDASSAQLMVVKLLSAERCCRPLRREARYEQYIIDGRSRAVAKLSCDNSQQRVIGASSFLLGFPLARRLNQDTQ